jgi:ABC-type uncharacterized transport system permease subunit
MSHAFLILTVLSYGVSLALYLGFLNTGKKLIGRVATLFLLAGIVGHYFALLERSRGLHTVPYHDLYGSLSLFGWLLALTYLAAHLAPPDRTPPPPAHGPVFALHVTLSILAYAAFALSFVLSLMFLAQERLLRSRRLGNVVWRLPPLDLLERMSRSSVLIGLLSIAVGTTLGFVWVDRLHGQFWYYDPKYVITLLVLLLYAAYFWVARTAAWRGARASKLCVFNFVVVILSFTVVNFYLSQSHRYF